MTSRTWPVGRAAARLGFLGLTAATAVVDVLPPGLRFGHARTLSRALLGRRVPQSVGPLAGLPGAGELEPAAAGQATTTLTCALVTASLGVGGVESVVARLAQRLPAAGIACTVITLAGGATAQRLSDAGVDVRVVDGDDALVRTVQELAPDVVQVHTLAPGTSDALIGCGAPIVSVLHSVELYRYEPAWRATARLDAASAAVVAVSRAVRDDHLRHVPARSAEDVVVIPNGTATRPADDATRARARRHLGDALGIDLDGDVVALCLARYDVQKNVVGLVDAFLLAVERLPRLRLVVAGGTADWLERGRADALRRSHAAADRVHLLGESDAATLLAASDLFVLDSFFEGWPVAATEAVRAGLPTVMADVGGAAELVGVERARGRVVPNAAGTAVSQESVTRARRSLHQRTRADFAQAVVEGAGLARLPLPDGLTDAEMVAAHARALTAAALATAST
jgi:glycosyltransferase involved in cell wall biosynthesis